MLTLTTVAWFATFAVFSDCAIISPNAASDTEVILVQAICRHGKRTTYSFYPTDPHINNSFYPVGPGGMLNEGKYTSFRLGQRLRQEYDKLLGSIYNDDLIQARSTDTVRTRMTAQLVMAGLFPPTEKQKWHPTLQWMPIPVYTKESDAEDTINPNCPYHRDLLENLPNSPAVYDQFIKPYEKLFEYVEYHSGKPIKSLSDLIEFYFIINTEQEMELPIPEWTKSIYPQEIYKAVAMVYKYQNQNQEAKRIHMGYFLKKMINDALAASKNEMKPKGRKMFVYGAHESTLGWMIDQMNVNMEPVVPPYSSSVIMEVHRDRNNNHYIKLRYLDDHDQPIRDLKMHNCNLLCPLQDFIKLNTDAIPTVSFQDACRPKAPKALKESLTSAAHLSTPVAFTSLFLTVLLRLTH